MSLHSAIMKLEPIVEVYDNDIGVKLTYNGHNYYGFAYCHKEDKDFFSEKVGATIAHYRAMIKIYDNEIRRAEVAARVLWSAYKDVIYNSQKDGIPVDPTSAFITRVFKARDLVDRYKAQRASLRTQLKEYLKNHEKCLESVRAQRKTENEDKNV